LRRAESKDTRDSDDDTLSETQLQESAGEQGLPDDPQSAAAGTTQAFRLRSPMDELGLPSRSLELDPEPSDGLTEIVPEGAGNQVSASDPASGAENQRVAGSSVQTPLMVETVSAMMMRLERMPEVNAGRWQFNLLNDPAGISSLQLQRSINGSWRIHLAMEPGAEVDQQQHADELKTALQASGFEVDSVELMNTSSDARIQPS